MPGTVPGEGPWLLDLRAGSCYAGSITARDRDWRRPPRAAEPESRSWVAVWETFDDFSSGLLTS
jgi:hypothetical protein